MSFVIPSAKLINVSLSYVEYNALVEASVHRQNGNADSTIIGNGIYLGCDPVNPELMQSVVDVINLKADDQIRGFIYSIIPKSDLDEFVKGQFIKKSGCVSLPIVMQTAANDLISYDVYFSNYKFNTFAGEDNFNIAGFNLDPQSLSGFQSVYLYNLLNWITMNYRLSTMTISPSTNIQQYLVAVRSSTRILNDYITNDKLLNFSIRNSSRTISEVVLYSLMSGDKRPLLKNLTFVANDVRNKILQVDPDHKRSRVIYEEKRCLSMLKIMSTHWIISRIAYVMNKSIIYHVQNDFNEVSEILAVDFAQMLAVADFQEVNHDLVLNFYHYAFSEFTSDFTVDDVLASRQVMHRLIPMKAGRSSAESSAIYGNYIRSWPLFVTNDHKFTRNSVDVTIDPIGITTIKMRHDHQKQETNNYHYVVSYTPEGDAKLAESPSSCEFMGVRQRYTYILDTGDADWKVYSFLSKIYRVFSPGFKMSILKLEDRQKFGFPVAKSVLVSPYEHYCYKIINVLVSEYFSIYIRNRHDQGALSVATYCFMAKYHEFISAGNLLPIHGRDISSKITNYVKHFLISANETDGQDFQYVSSSFISAMEPYTQLYEKLQTANDEEKAKLKDDPSYKRSKYIIPSLTQIFNENAINCRQKNDY